MGIRAFVVRAGRRLAFEVWHEPAVEVGLGRGCPAVGDRRRGTRRRRHVAQDADRAKVLGPAHGHQPVVGRGAVDPEVPAEHEVVPVGQ